nr:MAG TPA: hypothetical protein [Caudoviricetes sp.]DAS61516.1 MAG TPA: hypothetical protein [Caudoviricetes sp.]
MGDKKTENTDSSQNFFKHSTLINDMYTPTSTSHERVGHYQREEFLFLL